MDQGLLGHELLYRVTNPTHKKPNTNSHKSTMPHRAAIFNDNPGRSNEIAILTRLRLEDGKEDCKLIQSYASNHNFDYHGYVIDGGKSVC